MTLYDNVRFQTLIMDTISLDLIPSVNEIITDMDNSSITPPKRLFHIPSMSTVMYEDVAVDVREKGYVAISHVWGDQQMYSADELGINGIEWEIPLSDANKISRLVAAMNQYEKEYCWFDVLCMPQNRQDEINLEIPLMGDYYAGADVTLVLSTEDYGCTKDFIKWCDMVSDMMATQREPTEEENVWIKPPYKGYKILDISKDQWFTRIWTSQEAILSKELILVGCGGSHVKLLGLSDKMSYMDSKYAMHTQNMFGDSKYSLKILVNAIESHKNGSDDLVDVFSRNALRYISRVQDKFYGTLGILGYKNFPVSYEISMEDLNKKMAQYAYSKGDISWLTVSGDEGIGFIRLMYRPFFTLGSNWREDEPGGIKFENNTVCMDAITSAIVTRCENFGLTDSADKLFVGWAFQRFLEWELDELDITRTFLMFEESSDELVKMVKFYLEYRAGIKEVKKMVNDFMQISEDEPMVIAHRVANKILPIEFSISPRAIVMATLVGTNKSIPLIVYGNPCVGNEIKLMRIHDKKNRALGIILSDSYKNNGVCLYPKVKMSDIPLRYESCKFVL